MRGPLRARAAISGLASLLSLSSTTVAATNLIPHKPPARLLAQLLPSSPFQDASVIHVVAATGQCRPGELVCNDGCMPARSECCADGNGYCRQGYACVTDGCCPIGQVCGDQISCDLGEEPCGDKKCMPDGAVCCSDGAYCQAGEECLYNGFKQYCQRVDQSGDPHGGDGSKTAGGTETSGIAKATSSQGQSTTEGLGSKASHEETSVPTSAEIPTSSSSTSTSTSSQVTSSEHETNKSIAIPTPHLPSEQSTSSSASSPTSSSSSTTLGPSTTSPSNDDNAAAVKTPGLKITFVLAFVFIMAMTV
ncbi:hypothetical protein V8C37DRAFT_371339 [Trichoderma ceciliae]